MLILQRKNKSLVNMVTTRECAKRAKAGPKGGHPYLPPISGSFQGLPSEMWVGSIPVIFFGTGFFLVVSLFWHKQEQSCKINIVPNSQKLSNKNRLLFRIQSHRLSSSVEQAALLTGSSHHSVCLSNLVMSLTLRGRKRKTALCITGGDE